MDESKFVEEVKALDEDVVKAGKLEEQLLEKNDNTHLGQTINKVVKETASLNKLANHETVDEEELKQDEESSTDADIKLHLSIPKAEMDNRHLKIKMIMPESSLNSSEDTNASIHLKGLKNKNHLNVNGTSV